MILNLIKCEFHIFGGPVQAANDLRTKFQQENIFVHGHIKRTELSEILGTAHIGVDKC